MKQSHHPPSSVFSRFFQLSGLALRVGGSILAHSTGNLLKGSRVHDIEIWLKNARRIVTTLAKLKGGAMKVGQMLSLQEGIFPPEIVEILAILQRDIAPLPFKMVEPTLRHLHPHYENIFQIDQTAIAAASIGQVHRGQLIKSKEEIVLKLQYPKVAKAIRSDFRTLKTLLSPLLAIFTEIELEPIWQEIEKQLLRETNYQLELSYQRQFYERSQLDERDGLVPEPIEEFSGEGLIVSRYLPSLQGRKNIQNAPATLRNLWGEKLFTIILRQVLLHGVLHADPNLGNFGFLESGQVVLYDFGQVKEIPPDLKTKYRKIIYQALAYDIPELQNTLYETGMRDVKNDSPLPKEFIEDHLKVLAPLLSSKVTTIDNRLGLVSNLLEVGQKYWEISRRITFPAEILFVQRTLIGLLANIQQIGPTGAWGKILSNIVSES